MISKAISNCTFLSKQILLILLSEYQNSNEYPNKLNICCSPICIICSVRRLYWTHAGHMLDTCYNIMCTVHYIKYSEVLLKINYVGSQPKTMYGSLVLS